MAPVAEILIMVYGVGLIVVLTTPATAVVVSALAPAREGRPRGHAAKQLWPSDATRNRRAAVADLSDISPERR